MRLFATFIAITKLQILFAMKPGRDMWGKFISFIVGSIILSSCQNDLELLASYKEMPIVYCILNQNDSIHYLRLERSFVGESNAYEMALNPDSIYYKDADIVLERWKEREFISSLTMELTDTIKKDSGIFAYKQNRMYVLKDHLDGGSEYKIKINIPNIDKELTASTHLVDGIRIIKPAYTRPSINFSAYNNYLEIEWVSAPYARIYFLQLRFNYLEVYGRDTTKHEAIWTISHFVSKHGMGGERMKTKILHQRFYQWLPSKIPLPDRGIRRIAEKKALDVMFTVGGEELYTYMQIYDPDHNMMTEKPIYTNITNGIGLFSARYMQEVKGKALSFSSIDSVAHGQFTFQLGFVDSRDDYYNQ